MRWKGVTSPTAANHTHSIVICVLYTSVTATATTTISLFEFYWCHLCTTYSSTKHKCDDHHHQSASSSSCKQQKCIKYQITLRLNSYRVSWLPTLTVMPNKCVPNFMCKSTHWWRQQRYGGSKRSNYAATPIFKLWFILLNLTKNWGAVSWRHMRLFYCNCCLIAHIFVNYLPQCQPFNRTYEYGVVFKDHYQPPLISYLFHTIHHY